MNKILFGIIAILMLAILGVGGYALLHSFSSNSSQQTSGTYSLAQVAAHNSASSCYTAINGSVYDVTSWINQHPGGAEAILSLCGTDGSAAFNSQHGGQARPEAELASFKIGTLAQ